MDSRHTKQLLTLIRMLVLGAATLLLFGGPAHAQIAFRASATATSTTDGNIAHVGAGAATTDDTTTCPNTISPARPAGNVGDLLIALVVSREDSATVAVSAGWTLLYSTTYAPAGSEFQAYMYYRVATGTLTTDDAITVTQTGTCNSISGQISRFRGVDTTQPFLNVPVPVGNVVMHNTNDIDTGTETTVAPNAMLLVASFVNDNNTITEGAGWTASFESPLNVNLDLALNLHYQLQTTAGAKSISNWALSGTDPNIGVIFSLRPAGFRINVPPGTVAGDVMLAQIAWRTDGVIAAPAGWTLVRQTTQAGASAGVASRLATYWREATAADVAGGVSYAWSFSGTAGSGVAGAIVSYSGVDTSSPINVEGGAATPAATPYAHTAPGITPTVVNTMLVRAYEFATSSTWTPNAPTAGITERIDIASQTPSDTVGISMAIYEEPWATAIATGTRTATALNSAPNTDAADGAAHHMALRPAAINHYWVQNNTSGVNCVAENVTITAHNSSHTAVAATGRTITITANRVAGAAGNHGDWTLVTGSGTLSNGTADDGVATYAFAAGESSVILALKDTHVQTVNMAVTDGTITDTSGTASADAGYNQDLAFVNSGFRITDGSGTPAAANIATQTAGTTSATYGLQAIRTDTNTGACVGVFASGTDVTVELASQCNNPTTCIAGQNVTITNNAVSGTIASNPNSAVTTYTSRSLRFGANSQALFTLNYPDVGLISLVARYNIPLGTGAPSVNYMTGSSNQFVVKPAGFTLSAIQQTAAPNLANPAAANATGAVFVKAGEAFSVTVTATNSAGNATPNYGKETTPETVALTSSLVAGLGLTNNPALANPTAFGSFSAGVATGTTFSWTEVGVITLTPSVGDADYLGAGNVTGTTSGNVGRFYPDHFALSGSTLTNRSTSACAPASNFTYMGEPMSLAFTLTAQGPAPGNATLLNYVSSGTAANNFAKLATGTPIPAAFGFGLLDGTTNLTSRLDSSLGVTGTWLAGVLNATATLDFTRNAAPDGPYAALKIGLAPGDSDGVQLASSAFNMDVTAPAGNEHAQAAQTQVRFGRMRLGNAFGSTLIDLPLPLSTEFYNGTNFITNTDDSCTKLVASDIRFSFAAGNLSACETQMSPSTTISFNSGVATAKLTKPGSGNDGSVTLTVNLGAASGNTCTSGAASSATSAAKTWLLGNWGTTTYTSDPTGLFSFGQFKGADQFIYQRENF